MVLTIGICVIGGFSLLNLLGGERAKMMAKVKSEARNTPAPIPASPPTSPTPVVASSPTQTAASAATPKPAKPTAAKK